MRRLALAAFFLVAGCGSFGGAQAHSITLAYKAGDTYKYSIHATADYTVGAQGLAVPLKLDIAGKETATVKSVDSAGTADVSLDFSNLSLKTTMGGTTNTTTTGSTKSVEMKIASDGRIVSVNGEAFAGSSLPGLSPGGLISAVLPDNAVKPGDTWTKNYDRANPKGTGSVHVATKNKYVRDESTAGVNTAVVESNITTTLSLTFDMSALASQGGAMFPRAGTGSPTASALKGVTVAGTTTSDVTSWVDSAGHRMVKTHSTGTIDATITIVMAPGQTMPGLSGPIGVRGTQSLDIDPA